MRDQLSNDARQILGRADTHAAGHGMTVVYFSDLTRELTADWPP